MAGVINDANAGALTDQAPVVKSAQRTAVVAKEHGNPAAQKLQEQNRTASALGAAVGKFMDKKHQSDLDAAYMKAYNEKGSEQGLTEYDKDRKRTGFTEFIFGGQSPQYQGTIDAAAENTANALMIEESQHIEGEGANMSPPEYAAYLKDKVMKLAEENFSDAPDAGMAFFKQWGAKSNQLSKIQAKNSMVASQARARATAADGFQKKFDVYKQTIGTDSEYAEQVGRDMFTYDPSSGMAEPAWRTMVVEESVDAMTRGDITASTLLRQSGMLNGLSTKEYKKYITARNIIDEDTSNMVMAAKYNYESVMDNPDATQAQVEAAFNQHQSQLAQIAQRNTGSAKFLKSVYQAKRHSSAFAKGYNEALEADVKKGNVALKDGIIQSHEQFSADRAVADVGKRADMTADYIDELLIARAQTDDPKMKMELNKLITEEGNKLNGFNETKVSDYNKNLQKQIKAEQEEQATANGAQSLLTSGAYISDSPTQQKKTLARATTSVVDSIMPGKELSEPQKFQAIFADPILTEKFLSGANNFRNQVQDIPAVQTAVHNLANKLHALPAKDMDNIYSPEQVSNTRALQQIKSTNKALYESLFSADDRLVNDRIMDSIQAGKDPISSMAKINATSGQPVKGGMSRKDFLTRMNLTYEDARLQDEVFTEYKRNLVRGDAVAIEEARTTMNAKNQRVDGKDIRNAGMYKRIAGRDLDETVKILNTTIPGVNGRYSSGFSTVLQSVFRNDTTKQGTSHFNIKQDPTLSVEVFDGGLKLTAKDGTTVPMSKELIEIRINAYDAFKAEQRADDARRKFNRRAQPNTLF